MQPSLLHNIWKISDEKSKFWKLANKKLESEDRIWKSAKYEEWSFIPYKDHDERFYIKKSSDSTNDKGQKISSISIHFNTAKNLFKIIFKMSYS